MPLIGNNPAPPKVMTWTKALPALLVAGIFDALRLFFEMFWFFGPALGAALCTAAVNDYAGTTIAATGGQVVAGLCTAAAAAAGVAFVGPFEMFGYLMSDAFALAGFLMLIILLFVTNARLFKANKAGLLWLAGGLGIGSIPFIGAIPSYSIILFRLYAHQIRTEKAELKKYIEERAAAQLKERREQEAVLIEQRAAQQEYEEEQYRQEEEDRYQQEEDQRAAREREAPEGNIGAGESGEPSIDTEASAIQFETLKDALSELNAKMNRTPEENGRLNRAREIMKSVSINPYEVRDPVFLAAFERAHAGQKVYDGSYENRNGFKFLNLRPERQGSPNNAPYNPQG
ncbi:hypothetical protein KGM48_00545 [Patescibacteria group bacterium]|nr:hypothetical protein [Patescibacteria group bacterium]